MGGGTAKSEVIEAEIKNKYGINLPYKSPLKRELDFLLEKHGIGLTYICAKTRLEEQGIQFDPVKVNNYIYGMRELLKFKERRFERIGRGDYLAILRIFRNVIGSEFKFVPLIGRENGNFYDLNKVIKWIKENANLYPNTIVVRSVNKSNNDHTLEGIIFKHLPKKIKESGEKHNAIKRVVELVQSDDGVADCCYDDGKNTLRVYESKRKYLVQFLTNQNLRDFLKELVP